MTCSCSVDAAAVCSASERRELEEGGTRATRTCKSGIDEEAGRLQNGSTVVREAVLHHEMERHATASGTLAKDRDLLRITIELINVVLNPFQGSSLIEQSKVVGASRSAQESCERERERDELTRHRLRQREQRAM